MLFPLKRWLIPVSSLLPDIKLSSNFSVTWKKSPPHPHPSLRSSLWLKSPLWRSQNSCQDSKSYDHWAQEGGKRRVGVRVSSVSWVWSSGYLTLLVCPYSHWKSWLLSTRNQGLWVLQLQSWTSSTRLVRAMSIYGVGLSPINMFPETERSNSRCVPIESLERWSLPWGHGGNEQCSKRPGQNGPLRLRWSIW